VLFVLNGVCGQMLNYSSAVKNSANNNAMSGSSVHLRPKTMMKLVAQKSAQHASFLLSP
jgi:hypothetical protein